MKKYLWAVMVVLFMSANASDFKDIDISTHSFLSDLRAAAGSDDEFADEEEDTIDAPEVAEEKEAAVEEDVVVEEANGSEAGKTEAADQEAMDEAAKKKEAEKLEEEKKAEAAEAKKEKEALLAEIAAKEEALKQAKAQAEQEKREVEAYEKKRAEKLAKEAEEKAELKRIAAEARAAEKALAEKEAAAKKAETVTKTADIDLDAEKRAARDAADRKYWEAVQAMRKAEAGVLAVQTRAGETVVTQKETPVKKIEATDIDLDAEKRAAKEAADKEYLEAVQEMDEDE